MDGNVSFADLSTTAQAAWERQLLSERTDVLFCTTWAYFCFRVNARFASLARIGETKTLISVAPFILHELSLIERIWLPRRVISPFLRRVDVIKPPIQLLAMVIGSRNDEERSEMRYVMRTLQNQ